MKKTFDTLNPSTNEVIGTFPLHCVEEVWEACDRAKKAQSVWNGIGRIKRAEYLQAVLEHFRNSADPVAKMIALETGKSLNEAHAEVNESIHMAEYSIGMARHSLGDVLASELPQKDAYTMRKPKGVVGIISPWNFPVAIAAFWNAFPSLVEGNTVVWKPSELTPLCAELLHMVFYDNLPDNVFNVIYGEGRTGEFLVHNRDINHICFTGSSEVGVKIQHVCATLHKTCSVECGSKSSIIVCDDGDMDLAIKAGVASAFKLSGQRCVSSGRIFIEKYCYEEYCERFVEETLKLSMGDPLEGEYDFGPVISNEQKDKILDYNMMVVDDPQAEILVGETNGVRLGPIDEGYRESSSQEKGNWLGALVYKTTWRDVPYLKQEVFGPHVALIPFDNLPEAVHFYNDTDYGLGLGVVTNNSGKARYVRDNANFGMLYVNGGSIAAESHLPFGGILKSGNGHKTAADQHLSVTDKVSITVNYGDLEWCQGMK